MKFAWILLVIVLGFVFIFFYQSKNFSPKCSEGTVIPIFSPYNSDYIFDIIKNAKKEIKLEVYEFSSRELADALIDARERGVVVKVILEPSVFRNDATLNHLINNGIEVAWASKKFHNTHSKFAIIDDRMVFVGSMNWSENAVKKNREASVIIYSQKISSEFEKIFDIDFGG
jgi:phosphatidylserine/phosphatidylglycerophosphate/cardiolipin synthase-like enzyme